MDIKKRLLQYSDLQLERKQIEDQIENLRSQLTSIHSQSFDGIAAPTGNNDKIGEMIANLSDLQTIYIKKSNDIMKEMIELEKLMNTLGTTERLMMRKRYIECKPWEQVCVEMGYCYRGILKVHSRALQKLREIA